MFSKKKKTAPPALAPAVRKRPLCEVVHHFKAIHYKREKVAQRYSINPEYFKDFQLFSSLMLSGANNTASSTATTTYSSNSRNSFKKSLTLYVPRKRSIRYTRDTESISMMYAVENKKKARGLHKRSKTCDDFESVKQYYAQMSASAAESKRNGKSKSISQDIIGSAQARMSISVAEKRATIKLLVSQVSKLSFNEDSALSDLANQGKGEVIDHKFASLSTQEKLFHLIASGDEKQAIAILEQEFEDNDELRSYRLSIDQFMVDGESKCTLLHKAAKYQRIEVINFLLSKGASVHSTDCLDATPLMYAAAQGKLKACYYLLNKGATPNVKDRYEQSPLHIAIKGGHLEVASTLILFGSDINFKGRQGYTALMQACEEGNLTKVKYLLENGANIFRTNRMSMNCLMLALQHPPVVRHLIEYVKDRGGIKQVVKLLGSGDDHGRTVFHHCVEHNHMSSFLEIITIVNDSQADLILGGLTSENTHLKNVLNQKDVLGNTILHYAVKFKNNDFVKMLASSMEIDVTVQNAQGDTALHMALHENVITKALLSREAIEAIHLILKAADNYDLLKNIKNSSDKKTPKKLAKDQGIILKKLKTKDLNIVNYYIQYVQYSKSSSIVKFFSGGVGGIGSKMPASTGTTAAQAAANKRNSLLGGLPSSFTRQFESTPENKTSNRKSAAISSAQINQEFEILRKELEKKRQAQANK